jgi:hypothetical protein
MARHFNYDDDWETAVLECPRCGWTGTFYEGHTEGYAALMDSTCPRCPWPDDRILAIVAYATSPASYRGR